VSGRLDGLRIVWDDVGTGDRRATSRRLLDELLPGAVIRSGPCRRCGGPHGPVRAEGAADAVSVTYAGGLAIVASIPRSVASSIGIDAERGDADSPARIDRMRAGATVRDWTRVEAALKADGRGLDVDPALVRLDHRSDGWTAALPGSPAPILGIDAVGPEGVVLSVAIVPAGARAAAAGRPSA
jgi:4'-phosphopantetheinyl transferase